MRIAYLSHLDLNLFLFRLSWMKALIKEGHQVYVIVPEGNYFEKFLGHGIKPIPYKIHRGGLNPFAEIVTIWNLYRIFKREKLDLLHTFTIKPNIYGALSGKLAGTPFIINHVTGLGYVYTENSFRAKVLRLISTILYWGSFKLVNRVIFQNPDDLEGLKCLIDAHKAVIVKGTGVNVNDFSPQNEVTSKINKLREELPIKKNTIVITLIARLLWHKGIREFVGAGDLLTKRYKNLLFLVVGWIDSENPAAVTKTFIDEARRNLSIRFLGGREDIKEILGVTDIYVLPSYREGTPRTVLEAMAMGKPIITTDAPGCRQTVEDGVNGLLIPVKDSRSLCSTMEKLIIDKELRERMGKAGREKVIREFSDEVVIDQILSVYHDVTNEKVL
ncbi:MAG TPA: glycosyltransferase family 1 protein [Nitrospiria bacterium]|nr:glycosyltransferase family 1 protein [Candidatus Manganitrophaceae bacterium]